MLRFTLLAIVLGLSACTTLEPAPPYGIRLSEVNWPLLDLQKLVAYELPTGLRDNSSNGREFHSRYYVVDKSSYKPAAEALDRYTAHITILGADRPYQIEVTVDHERRVMRQEGYTYAVVGHDKGLAQELAYKIREALTKRREERNIIDDFRVF